MYLSAKEVFGQEMPAAFLLERIQSYDWKASVTRLAQLGAFMQSAERTDEDIRRRTIDPILSITGDDRAAPAIAHAHAYVKANRDRMLVAHEEVIAYLQHLVLVEGGSNDDTPTDAELAFWILGANCHLGAWAEEDSRELTIDEQLIATQVRGHTFNQQRNWGALAVRSYELFKTPPEADSVGDAAAWEKLQLETYGSSFERYYKLILAPLRASALSAGRENKVPAVTLAYWRTTTAEVDWVKTRLDAISVRRDDARRLILGTENARTPSGLLHAPSLLRRKPLLAEDEGWLVTSEAGLASLFHTGPWGAYLENLKAAYGESSGFKRWSAAFGIAFERYCAAFAKRASASPKFRRNWRVVVPSRPGARDEIEDVILIEDDHAIVFSIKSSLLPEGQVHRAKSRSAVIDWLDRFFFSEERTFKGALRKLSANIDEIRNGDFEDQGVSRTLKIYPVVITYDRLGEDLLLYQRLRRICRDRNVLTQVDVAPVALGSAEEFEWMMEYAAEGRSLLGLMRKRKPNRPWFDRRLDQQLSSVQPPVAFRITVRRFEELYGEVINAIRGTRADADEIRPQG